MPGGKRTTTVPNENQSFTAGEASNKKSEKPYTRIQCTTLNDKTRSNYCRMDTLMDLGWIAYEPEIASSSSNDNNDKDEKASPVYYALKIFPLCREVNRTDTNTNHPFHNHNDENDNSLQLLLKHSQQQQRSMLIQEIKTLCILRCDCLVHMVGAFYDKGVSVTMVLE